MAQETPQGLPLHAGVMGKGQKGIVFLAEGILDMMEKIVE